MTEPPEPEQHIDATPELVAELRKGRGVRWRVTITSVTLAVLMVVAGAVYRWEQRQACQVAIETRTVAEVKDRRLFTELGRALHASQAEVAAFMAVIEDEYDRMPTPAPC